MTLTQLNKPRYINYMISRGVNVEDLRKVVAMMEEKGVWK